MVISRKKRQYLLLYKDSSAKQIVNKDFKYLLLKSSCALDHRVFSVTLEDNFKSTPLSDPVCKNDTWTFFNANNSQGILTLRSDLPNEIAIHQIGMSNVTHDKTLGKLHKDGINRLDELSKFSKPPVLVAILGLRGSGKSTIASLISGNDKMFLQGSRSTKTTTMGIDISPAIPTNEYILALTDALNSSFFESGPVVPIVFTDSEGMGVRGDTIDFVATVPPLLFSNVIMWVTSESIRADEELKKLDRYLNLANKIQDNSGSLCNDFKGGQLIVIVNKMQGIETDEELTDELLEVEYESETTKERNIIRRKLQECFKSAEVVGFPLLSLPNEVKKIQYANIKGEGSSRFRQTLTKIVRLILNERGHAKVLAGITLTPVEMKSLYKLVLEKINIEGVFLDNELRDALFTVNIKRELTEHKLTFDTHLFEIERSKKNKDLVDTLHVLIKKNKKKLDLLLEESKNESRKKKIIIEEWKKTETHLKDSMENTVFFSFNAELDDYRSLLNNLLPICSFVPASDHQCLEKNFLGRISGFRALLKTLPMEISKRVFSVVETFDSERKYTFSNCSKQRMSFTYAERVEAEKLFQEGIGITKSVKSTRDTNEALKKFVNYSNSLVKTNQFDVSPSVFPCNLTISLENRHMITRFVESSFTKGLKRLQNSLNFTEGIDAIGIRYDFDRMSPRNTLIGKLARIFDQECDLQSILSSLPSNIEELQLICFIMTVYGYTSTKLRILSIETGYFNINDKGSTLHLIAPAAPPKSSLGQPGTTDLSGGVISIKTHFKVIGGVLSIEGKGGDGGEGGEGVPGSKGADGKNGSISSIFYNISYYDALDGNKLKVIDETTEETAITVVRKVFCAIPVPFYINHIICAAAPHQRFYNTKKSTSTQFSHTSIDATPGQKGVRGNPGKSGGKGGAPGRLRLDVDASFNKHFSLLTRGGKGGKGGTGGKGGAGGKGGNIKVLQTIYDRVWTQINSVTFKTGVDTLYENGEKINGVEHSLEVLKTDLTYEERWDGQEENGEIGEMGENGKEGSENKRESKVECTNIAENNLFAIFKEINSYSLRKKEESLYKGQRNIPIIVEYIENNIAHAAQQINEVSHIRAHYTNQLTGETLDNLVKTEMNLTDRSMYVHQIKQNFLREDLEKYINELSLVDDKISQFNAGSLRYIVENFRDKLFLEEKNFCLKVLKK
ncbi:uncharacterized protein LOC136036879 isoform X2 [Artemia franciscana]|uniref:uncharacterized protein LOC136036879 isoform X2 n=1 Tax=Artemia franciscana TaxID=6661 RepID=UPI0032DB40D5